MGKVLVTGGAGYIGSHTVRQLARAGAQPVTLDDLSLGHREAVTAGEFVEGSVGDAALLDSMFEGGEFEAVVHFAALSQVGESLRKPLSYFRRNVADAVTLLESMRQHGVRRLIFSSSCSVYGDPEFLPLDERHSLCPNTPCGECKRFLETMLKACDRADGLRFVALRYFNAAGASLDGQMGESHDPETHLIPRLLKVAKGELRSIDVFGTDYPTPDGTCVRDYVHVEDLAAAHVAALNWLLDGAASDVFNLGAEGGVSVLEAVEAARRITGREISVRSVSRRDGDSPQLVASSTKAKRVLSWKPQFSDLECILESAWKWELSRRY